MVEIISVRFKEGGKQYYFNPNGERFRLGEGVIVETARGVEFGECTQENTEVDEMELTAFEHYPNKAQAVAMRKLSKAGTLDMDAVVDIMEVDKPNQIEHVRYVPRKEDLLEQIPAYLKPEEWKAKDFTDFIGKAIAFYASSLQEQHAQEIADRMQEANRNRKPWERSI